MEREFNLSHLELDFHSIPAFNTAKEINYEVKETKDRDNNTIWELSIYADNFGMFDTYTYYNYEAMVRDIDVLESTYGIEVNGLLPY